MSFFLQDTDGNEIINMGAVGTEFSGTSKPFRAEIMDKRVISALFVVNGTSGTVQLQQRHYRPAAETQEPWRDLPFSETATLNLATTNGNHELSHGFSRACEYQLVFTDCVGVSASVENHTL